MFKMLFKGVLKLVKKWAIKTPTNLDNELISCLEKYIQDGND